MESQKQYSTCLTFLAMLYISIMLCSGVLIYKPINFGFGVAPAAILVFPLWFVLSDVIAEVYGKRISRKILYSGFICQFLVSIVCFLIIRLPSPSYWHNDFAFNLILGHLLRVTLGTLVAIIIAGYLNIFFLTRWKILLRGRKFWLRSIGASGIAEAIYCALAPIAILSGNIPLSTLFQISVLSFLFKITFSILLAFPANILVVYIRFIEGTPEFKKLLIE